MQRSYTCLKWYTNGNIISDTATRIIFNMLATTAAQTHNQEDSSEESKKDEWACAGKHAGSMDMVRKTLNCIAANDAGENMQMRGKHDRAINIGKNLWASSLRKANDSHTIRGKQFGGDTLKPSPTSRDIKQVQNKLSKNDSEIIRPFQGATAPYTFYFQVNYITRLE